MCFKLIINTVFQLGQSVHLSQTMTNPLVPHKKITLGQAKQALIAHGYTNDQLCLMGRWEIINAYKALLALGEAA